MKLFLVRHGETPWTLQGRYQGATDVPLNARGLRQARALARALRPESPDRIFTSTLCRARETARWIARAAKLRPVADPRLNEIHFGEWEGKFFDRLAESESILFQRWREGRLRRPPGGESVDSLARRVEGFFKEVTKRHSDETVIVVSHGGPLRMLLLKALKAERPSLWAFRIDPASVSLIEGSGRLFQVVWTNRTEPFGIR